MPRFPTTLDPEAPDGEPEFEPEPTPLSPADVDGKGSLVELSDEEKDELRGD